MTLAEVRGLGWVCGIGDIGLFIAAIQQRTSCGLATSGS